MVRSKNSNKKRNNRKTKTEEKSYPSVVGPDLFLLLQGRLFDDGTNDGSVIGGGKNVSLILCGESHNDAIDVTRRSPPGKFEPTEGWIQVFDSLQSDVENDIYTALPRALFVSSRRDAAQRPHSQPSTSTSTSTAIPTSISPPQVASPPSIENLALRYLHPVNGRKNKPVTLGRARELASAFVEKYEIEDDMFGRNLLLLWISTTGNSGRTEKGEAFLLEIESEAIHDEFENNGVNNNDDNTDSDSDDESYDDWVFFTSDTNLYDNPLQQTNRLDLPDLVARWMDDVMMMVHDDDSTAATIDDAIDDMNDGGIDKIESEDTTIVERSGELGSVTIPSMHRRLMHGRLGRYVLFEFGDLDSVAYSILKRRLGMTDAELTSSEYDEAIETRKRVLKEEDNVWTFDDWFDHVKEKSLGTNENQPKSNNNVLEGINDPAVHLVLEASVPPWEVDLHRPRLREEKTGEGIPPSTITIKTEDFRLHPAAECIRCLPEDSEASWEDECDPSNDGIGSYADFIYRKMMAASMKSVNKHEIENENEEAGISEEKKTENYRDVDGNMFASNRVANQTSHHNGNENEDNSWLHCIDVRDLGCEAACHAESAKQQWNELLSQEEREVLTNPKEIAKNSCPVNKKGDAMRFLPANKLNPEWVELERLKSAGLLVKEEGCETDDCEPKSENDRDEDLLECTFPSFECFFGSNTDNMYYSPHVKLAYSPFLFHCVESLDNWKAFFTALFFGGTIREALELLNLRAENSRNSVHVRSPILQQWDAETNSYVWKEREEEEEYFTCPFFPFAFHLVAKGSSPPRTWSSQLFANLHDSDTGQIDHRHPNSRRRVALAIKNWILESIHRNMDDPKKSDDKECGGEWFAAYLRATHRNIYDDIDNSDAAVLLQKNYMKSLSGGRLKKHNIGKVRIPSAKNGFEEILARFGEQKSLPPTENVVTPRVEVLAKILIDIWVSNLFDFSLLLKIASICANETTSDNVVIVCYVGSAHARVASDFFCGTLGFRRSEVVGKFAWEDEELQTLELPSKLWNLSELFR